jgi:glycogen operon protein
MITMGDEARRTQLGNNNAYCHDGELTWLDWGLVERHAGLRRFVRQLLHLRFSFEPSEEADARSLAEFLEQARIEWHGVRLGAPDWSADSRSLAVCFSARGRRSRVYAAFNAWWEPLEFELPPAATRWRRLVDTALPSPDDAPGWAQAPVIDGPRYRLAPRSMAVLRTWG